MNILFTTLTRFSGNTIAGGELYLLDLMKGLSKVQISPYLVFPDAGRPEYLYLRKYDGSGGYREYEFKGNSNIEQNFSEIIERFEIDIVHFQHSQTLPFSLMRVSKDLKRKLIVTIHDYFLWCENYFLLSPLKGHLPTFCFLEANETFCADCLKKSRGVWELVYRRPWNGDNFSEEYVRQRRNHISQMLGMADLIVSPSNYVRDCFLSVYSNLDPAHFLTLEHGMFKVDNNLSISAHKDSKKLKVAFLGEFKHEKGNIYFNELRNTVKDQRVEFYIIGSLKESIKSQNLTNLKIMGQYKREELRNILLKEGIDLILLLSPWAETFSYTLSEAVMNAVPVIATDIGAFRERISKYGVGFLVPYENPVPMIASLLKDITESPEILEFFRKNCIEAARSLKDVGTMVSEYVALYKKISSGDIK